jgi:glycosyltransferase involved in cell wall biosynthesis
MGEKPTNESLRVVILIPVYNDWDSLKSLFKELGGVSIRCNIAPTIIVVNDGSDQAANGVFVAESQIEHFREIEVIHLHLNLGHQSAIAVGLSEILHRHECDVVIVMDADGEDRPEDLDRLIQAHSEAPGRIIVAKRSRRSEGLPFRFFYGIYKLIFRLFVGKNLDFGNFCLIPSTHLGRLAFDPMTWNHLAAAISRSQLDITKLKSNRGRRFHGKSSMGIQKLISHGLSAVSVYLDVAMIRILVLSVLIMLVALVGVLTVIWLRLFTELAIPGWATSAVGVLSIIGLQGLILSTLASFLVLRTRSGISLIPAIDGSKFIKRVEQILRHD